jgi:hypothetical protein
MPDSLSTTAEPLPRLLKVHRTYYLLSRAPAVRSPSQATTRGRRVEKSGPGLEFNFLGRLTIILAFVLIQLPVGLYM